MKETSARNKNYLSTLHLGLANLLTALFSLSCCLIVLELGVRTSALFETKAPSPEQTELAHSDRPAYYYLQSNARAFRDFNYSYTKPADTYRIAAVGDSFTFPTLIQFDDAYPKRLERMLNLSHNPCKPDGRDPYCSFDPSSRAAKRIEVLNLGTQGHATTHEVKQVRKALKMGADLIILQITLNDGQLSVQPLDEIKHSFGRDWAFAPLKVSAERTPLVYYSRLARFIALRWHNRQSRRDFIDYHKLLFKDPKNWSAFEKSITKIHFLTQRRSANLVAVIMPFFQFPLTSDYPFNDTHRQIAEMLKSHAIPTLDMLPHYQGLDNERLQVLPGLDAHPNEIAHRIAAEQIYLWLEPLLPREFTLLEKYGRQLDRGSLMHRGDTTK